MPQAIAYVGAQLMMAGIAEALGAFLLTHATFLGTAAILIGTAALSNAQKRTAERRGREQYNASQVDRLANLPGTTNPRELVLGRVRKGGSIIFKGSIGTNKEKLVLVLALAGHEIDAVEKIYLNDQEVTLDGDGYVTSEPYMLRRTVSASVPGVANPANAIPGTVTFAYAGESDGTGATYYQYYTYTPKARIRAVLGSPTQAADSRLMELFPGIWTNAHRARGVAYLVCEFDFDETAFPSGPPNVTAVIRGARVYDPRTGLTAWTENPALMARHVLVHPQFGKRTSLTSAEEARIIAAANACDSGYNYGDGSVALYRAATVIPFGATARDVLDDLAQSMAGAWAYAAGEFFIRAGVYAAPVAALSDAQLAVVARDGGGSQSQQAINISTHRARSDKVNVVTPRIWDAAQDYKQAALTPLKVAAFITRDGAELVQEVEMPAVFYARQAQHIAGVLMRDARDPLTVTLPFKLGAYAIELFDTVSLTIGRFGWSSKPFLVVGRTWSQDGRVLLTLKETAAAIYQPDATFAAQGYALNTTLPRPWDIPAPTLVSITSGTNELLKMADGSIVTRVRVQWQPFSDASLLQGGQVEVQWLPPGANVWQSITVPATETQAYLLGVRDGLTIVIRARSRNSVATSDWCLQQAHSVVGKTAAPANLTGLATSIRQQRLVLSWSANTADVDLDGYEVRTADSGWGDGSYVYYGPANSAPVVPAASGVSTTWFVRARDTSRNYSAASASVAYTTPAVAEVTSISASFADTSLTSATVTLDWPSVAPLFGLAGYEVSYGAVTKRVSANTITLPADWLGSRTFTVKVIDQYGNVSSGFSQSVTKLAPNPVTNLRAQVIDNNVLLYWSLPARTTLPIQYVRIKKGGTSWATATYVGTKDGEFTSLAETVAGTYTYWVAVVDTDGNESAAVSLVATVAQPPDYVFNGSFAPTFAVGTKVGALMDVDGVVMPVNTTETFAGHFTSRTWNTPSDQIAAGFPVFIQPSSSSGYYEETFDYGVNLGSTKVTLTLNGAVVAGSPTITPQISVSANGTTWTDYAGQTSVFVTNIRYVRIRVTASDAAGTGIYKLAGFTVSLDSKQKSDSGTVSAVSTDASGTVANFNIETVDVVSLTLTPSGTTPATAVYDFLDALVSGTYSITSNVCTVTATGHGLVTGQRVRLSFSTGTAPSGVYTVTGATATTFTVAITTANTSGAVSLYSQGFRVYLFNSAGARISGTVSWQMKGY